MDVGGHTTPTVTDMVPGVEIFDPLFQWAPIPGAASYELEINTTSGFATGSKLFSAKTGATSFAPTRTLPNNTYYWRVRGLDPQGQAGPWNNGPTFDKTYDQTAVPGPPNLTVYDSKLQAIPPGGNVDEPVVTWSTVPGARHYELQTACDSGTTIYNTANTAWTPFGSTGGSGHPPFFNAPGLSVQQGSPLLSGDTCDVYVRAFTDSAIDGTAIAGPYATDELRRRRPAVVQQPAGQLPVAGPSGCAGRLNPGADVISPGVGADRRQEPAHLLDAGGHGSHGRRERQHRLLGRDRAGRQLHDGRAGAFTDEPCYAPRSPLVDEGTLYYWQVIPTVLERLRLVRAYARLARRLHGPPSFQHASVPPTPIRPVVGGVGLGNRRVPVEPRAGAGQGLHDRGRRGRRPSARTSSRSPPTPPRTRRPGSTRSARRCTGACAPTTTTASGLAWSPTSTFVQTLPVPTITTAEPFLGATFPALTWTPVDGATGYEVQDVWPDGSSP